MDVYTCGVWRVGRGWRAGGLVAGRRGQGADWKAARQPAQRYLSPCMEAPTLWMSIHGRNLIAPEAVGTVEECAWTAWEGRGGRLARQRDPPAPMRISKEGVHKSE